jgi:hypothetical protein
MPIWPFTGGTRCKQPYGANFGDRLGSFVHNDHLPAQSHQVCQPGNVACKWLTIVDEAHPLPLLVELANVFPRYDRQQKRCEPDRPGGDNRPLSVQKRESHSLWSAQLGRLCKKINLSKLRISLKIHTHRDRYSGLV